MIQFFRRFFQSKIGLGITLLFLAVIAFAFASSDVANNSTFGGVAGGDRVAVVGGERIGTAELSQAAGNALNQVRQQNPTISMPAFIAQGGLTQVLDQLVDRYAIATYAEANGLRAGDNLINSEIRQIPSFRGSDGNFDAETFRQSLIQQGISESAIRDDIRSGLLAQQVITPATFGAVMPDKIARRYALLFKERRNGGIAFFPSASYAPTDEPSDEELNTFYTENREDFIRPERRVVRFASFNSEAVDDAINPSDEEVAARYENDAALYAAREDRTFTQLIVPTEAAATALREQVAGGAGLEEVAQNAGLRTSELPATSSEELSGEASADVAAAYFAANRGALTAPAQSPLGWHIARVNGVETRGARSLGEVRGEIVATMREENRSTALADLAAEIEEELVGGETLNSVAERLELELTTTEPITADGAVYETQGQTAPPILAPAIENIFEIDESEPQVDDVGSGQVYLVYEVASITESAAAPLADIKDGVMARWRLSKGSGDAREAADRVLAKLADGTSLSDARGAEDKVLPPIQQINLTREELARQAQQRIPSPLALLFSMAKGTSKKLAAQNDLGWFVVDVDTIELGEIANDDPLIAQAATQLGPAVGEEYTQQLLRAMRDTMGVETNEAAVDAVRKRLLGEL
jgi:peptidyl-prolyl cis-trans isomerase D